MLGNRRPVFIYSPIKPAAPVWRGTFRPRPLPPSRPMLASQPQPSSLQKRASGELTVFTRSWATTQLFREAQQQLQVSVCVSVCMCVTLVVVSDDLICIFRFSSVCSCVLLPLPEHHRGGGTGSRCSSHLPANPLNSKYDSWNSGGVQVGPTGTVW